LEKYALYWHALYPYCSYIKAITYRLLVLAVTLNTFYCLECLLSPPISTCTLHIKVMHDCYVMAKVYLHKLFSLSISDSLWYVKIGRHGRNVDKQIDIFPHIKLHVSSSSITRNIKSMN